jgi:Flp pilus assembly protein TadD
MVIHALSVATTRLVGLACFSFLLACSNTPGFTPDLAQLQPLQRGDHKLSVADAELLAPTPDLLAMNDDMRDFVDRYVTTARSPRQRLKLLHSSLRSSALLDIDYDPGADGTAAEAFARGTANCLTYAHLFVAMARYAGLDAHYHSQTLRPQWSRYGTRVALRQHVNVLVRLRREEHYLIDIDPVSRDIVAATRILDDTDAFALYHNNLAMSNLSKERVSAAYAHAVKAVAMSPETDYLWVNLGAIYSRSGQPEAASESYLTAISLNADSQSAMNNLVVLFNRNGNKEAAAYWEQQVAQHRHNNPYYYMYLGEQAEIAGDLQLAITHYRDAIKRQDNDPELYFRLGKLYLTLDDPRRSARYVEMAIQRARVVGEREEYQAFLDQIEGRTLALR